MEEHNKAYYQLLKATGEVRQRCPGSPVKFGDLDAIAKNHGIKTYELLASLSLDSNLIVDYSRSEVRCRTK